MGEEIVFRKTIWRQKLRMEPYEKRRKDLERILAKEQGRTMGEHDSRSQQKGVSQWRGPGVSDAGGGGGEARNGHWIDVC